MDVESWPSAGRGLCSLTSSGQDGVVAAAHSTTWCGPCCTHVLAQSSWGPPEMGVVSFPSPMQKQGSERLSDLAEVTQLGAKVDMELKSKKSVH